MQFTPTVNSWHEVKHEENAPHLIGRYILKTLFSQLKEEHFLVNSWSLTAGLPARCFPRIDGIALTYLQADQTVLLINGAQHANRCPKLLSL